MKYDQGSDAELLVRQIKSLFLSEDVIYCILQNTYNADQSYLKMNFFFQPDVVWKSFTFLRPLIAALP